MTAVKVPTNCPLCGTLLTREKYLAVIAQHRGMQRELDNLRLAQGKAEDQVRKARKQRDSAISRMRTKASKQLELERKRAVDRERKYRKKAGLLAEQVKDLKWQIKSGETPQTEGLLAEGALYAFLKEHFRDDGFEHKGKGGDILHEVRDERGRKAGLILYEVKRMTAWSNDFVKQCAKDCATRDAQFAILVTNRFPAKHVDHFADSGVLVVSPLTVLPVVHSTREGLLHVQKLGVSGDEKEKAVRAVYDYLAGGDYTTQIKRVAKHLRDLQASLEKERKRHHKDWETRELHHRGIAAGFEVIQNRLKGLLEATRDGDTRQLPNAKALLLKGLLALPAGPKKP